MRYGAAATLLLVAIIGLIMPPVWPSPFGRLPVRDASNEEHEKGRIDYMAMDALVHSRPFAITTPEPMISREEKVPRVKRASKSREEKDDDDSDDSDDKGDEGEGEGMSD